MKSDNEKLVRTIQALMAKANDPGVTEAEALAYSEKAQELLAKHNIAMADITNVGDDTSNNVNGTSYNEKEKGWKSESRKQLLRAVCRFYMCEAVGPGRGGSKTWIIVGKPVNVEVAVSMTDYLIQTTIRLSGDYGRANRGLGVNVIDFRRGCMARLAERLNEMRRDQLAKTPEYQPNGNPGNLPALFRSENEITRAWMKQHLHVTFGKTKSIKEGSDAANGRAAAEKIGLNTQIGGGRTSGRLMIGSR